MYVPTTPTQSAAVVAPAEIASSSLQLAAPPFARPVRPRPARSALRVRRAELNVLLGQPATVTGTLRPGLPGWAVTLQARGRRGWSTVADTRTGQRGRFKLRYLPRVTGSDQVRVSFAGNADDRASQRRLGRLNVFRTAQASWYAGAGSLACGGQLTSSTMGVANKTLPCGTLVTLRYGGRSVRVPVVDRGPYVAGREFDLTQATKQALGFGDTGEVWSTS
jgi:rare lipoprotein A